MKRDLRVVSLSNRGFSCSLFLVVSAVRGVFYTLSNFFSALSLTFRGHEAGLFHAYRIELVPVVYVSANVF